MRNIEQVVDELLVIRAQGGEARALEVLALRWNRRLVRLALRLLGSRDNAAEATQEAWLAIVRGMRRLDDPAMFGPWAFRIVRNKCADRLRVQQREASEPLPDSLESDADVDQESDPGDAVIRLRRAMRRLPADRRQLLSMFYFDGMAVAEVAAATGVPPGTIKSRLFHIRALLRRIMEEEPS